MAELAQKPSARLVESVAQAARRLLAGRQWPPALVLRLVVLALAPAQFAVQQLPRLARLRAAMVPTPAAWAVLTVEPPRVSFR
jgi:hypothetical protein